MAGGAAEAAFERRLPALRALGAVPYGVVGDSHSRMLVRRNARDGRWLAPIATLETGASARGLAGDGGRSGAGPRVRAALTRLLAVEDLPILVKFGQVDVEFVHTFKRLAAGAEAFDEAAFSLFVTETVSRYVDFLTAAVPAADRARVRVMSLFPPTLSDAAWRSGYVNAHLADLHGPGSADGLGEALARLEIPDLERRTRLHAGVGELLRQAVEAEGFRFGDDLAPLLGPEGVVDPALLGSAAGGDHHIDFHASRAAMLDRIWSIVD